jgi:hypothetical protein
MNPGDFRKTHLLLPAENPILCRLGDAEFDDGLGGNLDLLLRLWIKPRARLPLLFHQFAKTGHDKFAALFGSFIGDGAERIKKHTGRFSICLRGFGKCGLEVLSWSFEEN